MSHERNQQNKKKTSRTRRELQSELMENDEIVQQSELNPFSARTRREPSGELMEEGQRHSTASARRPNMSVPNNKRPQGFSLNVSQPSLSTTSRRDQQAGLYHSHRDFLALPMATGLNQQAIYSSKFQGNLQGGPEDSRRSSIVSIASSIPTTTRDTRQQSLVKLREADKTAFFGRLRAFIKALAHEGIKLDLPFLVLDHLAINRAWVTHPTPANLQPSVLLQLMSES